MALELEAADAPRFSGDADLLAQARDWLATINRGLVSARDPGTFSWPGMWLALCTEPRSPTGWRPVVMFGVPSGILFDPLGTSGGEPEILEAFVPAPLDQQSAWRATGAGRAPGSVIGLMLAERAAAPAIEASTVRARPGGIDGDRYQRGVGTFSGSGRKGGDLTLIEVEALDELRSAGIMIEPVDARRNVITRGIALDALIGTRFQIGDVVCFGQRRAEPCAHLQSLTEPGVLLGLVHRGGLRADILTEGEISVGDEIRPL